MRGHVRTLLLGLPAAGLLWVLAAPAGPPPAGPGEAPVLPAPLAVANCKPEGPVRLELQTEANAGALDLRFTLQPLLALHELDWRWELSPELVLISGDLSARAAPEAGAQSGATARVALRGGAVAEQAVAELVVTARFTGHDTAGLPSEETVQIRRRLRWSNSLVDAPVRFSPESHSGERVPFVSVPVVDVPTAMRPGLR